MLLFDSARAQIPGSGKSLFSGNKIEHLVLLRYCLVPHQYVGALLPPMACVHRHAFSFKNIPDGLLKFFIFKNNRHCVGEHLEALLREESPSLTL